MLDLTIGATYYEGAGVGHDSGVAAIHVRQCSTLNFGLDAHRVRCVRAVRIRALAVSGIAEGTRRTLRARLRECTRDASEVSVDRSQKLSVISRAAGRHCAHVRHDWPAL